MGAAWHLADIEVEDTSTGQKYMFPCGRWLSKNEDDKQICRELTCSNLQSPHSKDRFCEYATRVKVKVKGKCKIDFYSAQSIKGSDPNMTYNIGGGTGFLTRPIRRCMIMI